MNAAIASDPGSSERPTGPALLLIGAYPPGDLDALEQRYRLLRLWEEPDPAALLSREGTAIRAVATRGDLGASAELIGALPALEIIACYGVGTDAIDLAAASARGIRVTNTPDVLTGDVADLAVGLTLAVMRAIPQGDAHVRGGAWAASPMRLVRRVHGRKVGIVGYGRIGAAVARRFAGFDAELGAFSRSLPTHGPCRPFATLEALAHWADILVVTLAGGADTRGVVDGAVLRALGPAGYLVNVSRGTTVDEAALLDALESGVIAGAGLDVFLNEPRIDPRFATLPNVVLQPHHASGTVETRAAMGQLVWDNLAAHFAGQPLLTPVR